MEYIPPIIIPSKSIYKKQNPKIRDNVIDNIEVGATEITPSNKYEEPCYNLEISQNEFSSVDKIEKFDVAYGQNNVGLYNNISKSYASLDQKYLIDFKISINDKQGNSYISKIYQKLNKNGQNNIKHTVFYDYKEYDVSVSDIEYKISTSGNSMYEVTNLADKSETLVQENSSSGEIPSDTIIVGNPNIPTLSGVEIKDYDQTNLSTLDVYYENGIYSLTIKVLVGIEKLTLFGSKETSTDLVVPCNGKRIIYEPKSLEITIYGDTIGIDLTDKTITIGEGNKPLSFDGNELMQTSNALNAPINGETNAIKYLYGETLNAFKNGKETATIRCSISNYYNEIYDMVIDIEGNRMCFEIGDDVIPYVYGANGQDIPMSRHKDGSPKVFTVVGTNIIYDGAVWQELTLIEKNY